MGEIVISPITKTQINRLKGLVHTISGTRICDQKSRIGIIIKYLTHQASKSTTKVEEKDFYNNIVNHINANDGLRKFLNIREFRDSLVLETDGRKEKHEKRDKQNIYMYFIVKEFLNHIITEKLRGN
ncbi:MAG: hypothetical protein ACFFDN_20595 [Candidatus Hodarchaeota archaeon]